MDRPTRREETGATTIMRALHSPISGPGDGIPRMVASHLGCIGLTGERALARVSSTVRALGLGDEHTHRALTQLALSSSVLTADEKPLVRFGRAAERDAVVQRFLAALSTRQGVLIWLDDVQWGADALALAAHLLDNPGGWPCRVLMVLTARDEALAQRPVEQRALDTLMAHPRAERLDLNHLDTDEHAALDGRLLCLEGDLARQVEARTAGNPLFAIQLVGDWVQRGVLDVGDTGFVLKDGAKAWIPDDLFEVWSTHLSRVLDHHTIDARNALELAAALGQDIESQEWDVASKHLRATIPDSLIEDLAAARLARRTHGGWAFVHGMLREALERLSTAAERWAGQHLACVAMLRELYPAPTLAVHERLARHLLAADEQEDALDPLLRAAREHNLQSRHQTSVELLDMRRDAMDKLRLAPEDPRWGENWGCARTSI